MTCRFQYLLFFFVCNLLLGTQLIAATGKVNDTLPKYTIQRIYVIGNRVTKYRIITRELTFKECDLLDTAALSAAIKQSRLNLMNTTLFNFVAIHYVIDEGEIFVYIKVTERWYVWPSPILEIPDRNANIWLQMRDFTRLNYGAYVVWNNFRGRRETLQFIMRFGYAERYGVSYNIPNLGKHQRSGIGFSYGYSRNHEIGYKSVDNVLLFYNDDKVYTRQEQFARLRYTYRKVIFNSHAVELRYNQTKVTDTIVKLAPTYTFNDRNRLEFFSLNYFFASDHRDYRPYPLRGWIYTLDATQTGLGILKDEGVSFLKLESGLRYYNHFGGRWYGAYGLKGKWSSSTQQPYYVQRGLGYSDYLRGYEYYVIDGHQYGTFKTNIKYQLVKPGVIDFDYFKNDRFDKLSYAFYLNAFFDAGYVRDALYYRENALNNTYLYSYGLGIDFVGYYDMVFRFELARNRQQEFGFYLHYFAPI
jgi:outer membrane protein assembly factor BamA